MLINSTHDQEVYWLHRRINYLTRLDALADRDADALDYEALATQFEHVETPGCLINRIRDIYGYVE
jgi:hypothetical protein